MKNFVSKAFGKLTVGLLLIALQFFWVVFMVYGATMVNSVIELLFEILAVILSLHIANKDIRTSYKMSWIFLILMMPFFGITAYAIFGRPEITKRTRRQMMAVAEYFVPFRKEDPKVKAALYEKDVYAGMRADYISNHVGYPLYYEDSSKYYGRIEDLYEQYLKDLQDAKQFIFLEYFILERGKMFDKILEILEEKAKAGVVVRIIYDDMGCVKTLPSKFVNEMKEKGISCIRFNPFRPMMAVIMNNRDHRKITVIDGKIAYTGGFNLADEYINEVELYGHWKDAGLRLTGSCVWNFTTMFLEMWDYITKEKEDCFLFKPSFKESVTEGKEHGFVQPYGDSPMDNENVGENVYLNLISHAKKAITIFTPYLIIGSEMSTALINAVKTGVDVKIVVPGIPDKKLVYMLTKANFLHLLKGGVKIYTYTPGFLHSKCFLVDDAYAVVGTINLDYRSLYLHFECGTVLYHTPSVLELKQDMLETLEVCKEVELNEIVEKRVYVRMFYGVLKLLSPLF